MKQTLFAGLDDAKRRQRDRHIRRTGKLDGPLVAADVFKVAIDHRGAQVAGKMQCRFELVRVRVIT